MFGVFKDRSSTSIELFQQIFKELQLVTFVVFKPVFNRIKRILTRATIILVYATRMVDP